MFSFQPIVRLLSLWSHSSIAFFFAAVSVRFAMQIGPNRSLKKTLCNRKTSLSPDIGSKNQGGVKSDLRPVRSRKN
jgi:hypothetical protein